MGKFRISQDFVLTNFCAELGFSLWAFWSIGLRWTNVFTIEMFISANFVQKSTSSNHSFKSWTRWTIFICFAIFSGIRGKLFWSSICSIKFSPLKCSFLLILYEKSTLNDHGFSRWAWHSGKFFLFVLSSLRVFGESRFKGPKVPLDEFFYHWNVQFANFARKINFEWSQFQKVGVTPYFYWLFSLCYWY